MNPKKKKNNFSVDSTIIVPDVIPENVYPVIDTDVARDNIENDLSYADRQDITKSRPKGKQNLPRM